MKIFRRLDEICRISIPTDVRKFLGWKTGDTIGFIVNEDNTITLCKKTNADRIRNMTDEELAEFIMGGVYKIVDCNNCDEPESEYGSCIGDCRNPLLKWLQAEVKEGAE